MNSISVIVPVYNVAPYLERCLESVLSQTIPTWEMILIDDGSTDGSDLICDRYASKDRRIRVIHQTNSGLSAARNKGIAMARGDYLTFVDSDDWIHPAYLEKLKAATRSCQCKIAMAGVLRCKQYMLSNLAETLPLRISRDDAIPRMLRGEWISAWAKLYHRSLFDDLLFPEKRNNEDYAILIYLFERCDVLCFLSEPLYYYFVRENSITNSPLNPHSFDEFFIGQDVWNHCLKVHPQWSSLALFNLTASIIKLSGQCVLENKYLEKYDQLRLFVSENKRLLLDNPELSFKYKPFLWALLAGKGLHRSLMHAYQWKHRD